MTRSDRVNTEVDVKNEDFTGAGLLLSLRFGFFKKRFCRAMASIISCRRRLQWRRYRPLHDLEGLRPGVRICRIPPRTPEARCRPIHIIFNPRWLPRDLSVLQKLIDKILYAATDQVRQQILSGQGKGKGGTIILLLAWYNV